MKKYVAICLCLVAAATVSAQTRSKRTKRAQPVKQTREVVEAYAVVSEFQRLLLPDLDFDRAFEATFTKDPARRRAIAIAESELGSADSSQVDDATLLGIYKDQTQFLLLMLPLVFGDAEKSVVFPPPIDAMLDRVRQKEPKPLQSYAAQLKRDLAEFRTHVAKLLATRPEIAEGMREFKNHLSKPIELPNHIVKPLTSYSKGNVLPLEAEYYQIGDYAVIREDGRMRIIGIVFFRVGW